MPLPDKHYNKITIATARSDGDLEIHAVLHRGDEMPEEEFAALVDDIHAHYPEAEIMAREDMPDYLVVDTTVTTSDKPLGSLKNRTLYSALYELLSHFTEEQRNTTVEELGEQTCADMNNIMTRLDEVLEE